MPAVVTFTQINLLTPAPTAADPPSTFPLIAHNFFGWLWTIVGEINDRVAHFTTPPTPLSTIPHPPNDQDAGFAAAADAHLAAMPGLVGDANGMIDELGLPCAHITALPTPPSRTADPTGFATTAATLLAALPTFRTEFNAFINALNAYITAGGSGGSGAATMLVSQDFKNGVYSIGGVSKTLAEVIEHNSDVGPFSTSSVVAGVGLTSSAGHPGSVPTLTPEAFAAVTAHGNDAGFTVVLTLSLTGTSSLMAKALISYSNSDTSAAWEGYAENFNGDNSAEVYDYASADADQDSLPTLHKVGFTFTHTGLSSCVDGGTVSTTAAPQALVAAFIYLQVYCGGSGAATATIEKAEFYATVTGTGLQTLTA